MMMIMMMIMIRSMAATVPEQSQLLVPGLTSADQEPQEEAALAWSRLPGQACKIPTQLLSTIESGAR